MNPTPPAVSEAPLGRRAKVVEHGFDHVRLGRMLARPDAEWRRLLASWADLPADRYVKPPDPGRFRCYGRYSYTTARGSLDPLAHAPFFQPLALNAYAGGIRRDFEPMTAEVFENAVLRATINASIAAFIDHDDPRTWEIGVHQIRVVGTSDNPGRPTPEGLHRDGFDFVAIHLFNRQNVSGAASLLRTEKRDATLTLLEPLETLFVDDRRCMHAATDMSPTDPTQDAVRDTLIVTFHHVRS